MRILKNAKWLFGVKMKIPLERKKTKHANSTKRSRSTVKKYKGK